MAVTLVAVTAATFAAPPVGEPKGPAALTVAAPPAPETKGSATRPVLTPPAAGQPVVLSEAALQAMLRDAANATSEEHERKIADLVAQLNVQKEKKKALLDALVAQIATKQGQAATYRQLANDRRAKIRATVPPIPTPATQELVIAQDKLLKDYEAGAAAFEGQIPALQAQYATAVAPIDAEIKRLLQEIEKLQRDEDEDRDRRLAEIESEIEKNLAQLAEAGTRIRAVSGNIFAKPQRDAAITSASDALKRVKSVREGFAIGRASKRPKSAPVGSSRSSG